MLSVFRGPLWSDGKSSSGVFREHRTLELSTSVLVELSGFAARSSFGSRQLSDGFRLFPPTKLREDGRDKAHLPPRPFLVVARPRIGLGQRWIAQSPPFSDSGQITQREFLKPAEFREGKSTFTVLLIPRSKTPGMWPSPRGDFQFCPERIPWWVFFCFINMLRLFLL